MYAKGTLMTPWRNWRYSLMHSTVPAISDFLIFGSTLGFLHSSLSFFWSVKKCTVSSFTPIISQSAVHLHLWCNRKMVSFRFSWAIIETCCPLSGIPSTFLPPDFLITLQMSSTFLSVRTLSFTELSSPCSLTSKLAFWGYPDVYILKLQGHNLRSSCPLYPQDPHIHILRHHPQAEGPIMENFHFCILCVSIDHPLILSN